MKKIISTVFCLLAILSCGSNKATTQGNQQEFPVITVDTTSVTLSTIYPASIQGRQDIAIFPQVGGRITKVCVKEGQRVTKGQSLFIIDQVPYKSALQMAEANVEAAEAAVASAQLVYDSRVQLFKKEVISEFDLLTSKNSLLSAKAGLAQAEASLVTAQNNMTYTEVLSPADGVVGTLPLREGALVSPSGMTPLTTVSDNSQMYVYYSLSETDLYAMTAQYGSMKDVIAAQPDVTLHLADGSTYSQTGRVETISGVINQSTASVQVRAVFPNKGGILLSGSTGTVDLKKTYNGTIMIPASSTFEIQDKRFVYKVIDGKAVAQRVDVKMSDDTHNYIVLGGLELGDVIVKEGAGLIKSGDEIITK
jgi:membrane fusion protein (multidrug efflux system)